MHLLKTRTPKSGPEQLQRHNDHLGAGKGSFTLAGIQGEALRMTFRAPGGA